MPFAKVNYGDTETFLITKDCSAKNIIQYLGKMLHWNFKEGYLDLCNAEGKLVGLFNMGFSNAKDELPDKDYFPVSVQEDGKSVKLLLATGHSHYDSLSELLAKLFNSKPPQGGTEVCKNASVIADKCSTGKNDRAPKFLTQRR